MSETLSASTTNESARRVGRRSRQPRPLLPEGMQNSEGVQEFLSLPRWDEFWNLVVKGNDPDGCWVWTGPMIGSGYGRFSFLDRRMLTHRWAWLFHHNADPFPLDVLHKCDNPPCLAPHHLLTGTHRENLRDAWSKGRLHQPPRVLGVNQWKCKINEDAVREIRKLKATGLTHKEIGIHFGVSSRVSEKVIQGTAWAHVK